MLVNLHQPRARADVRVGIQIRDVHKLNLTTDGHGWTQIKLSAFICANLRLKIFYALRIKFSREVVQFPFAADFFHPES
jgi:hypothetical protein